MHLSPSAQAMLLSGPSALVPHRSPRVARGEAGEGGSGTVAEGRVRFTKELEFRLVMVELERMRLSGL